MNTLDMLEERGFVHDVSNRDGLRSSLERPITLYDGFDPTRSSLQVGNLVGIMMLAHFQREGHRPIALIGGGTGMIGDPSGKTEMRDILSLEQIESNIHGVRPQFERYIEFDQGRTLLLNNADWLLQLGYIEFLRDIGRHFTVNQLMQHETYRDRFQNDSLSFIELNYALAQAYDFLHLFREYGCVLQIGGSDQWFNILAGVDLIRRVEGKEAYALVSPLITTAAGAKMGKTADGAVWLDANLTSPHEFYQYWVNTDDRDVERFLKLFTFLSLGEIRRLGALTGADLREAKQVLAFEVTRLTHGEEVAQRTREAAEALFRGGVGSLESVPGVSVPRGQLEAGLDLLDALVETGLASSKTHAKTLVRSGGVSVNRAAVAGIGRILTLDDLDDGQILLQRGKKEFRRLTIAGDRSRDGTAS